MPAAEQPGKTTQQLAPADHVVGAGVTGKGQPLPSHVWAERDDCEPPFAVHFSLAAG